jgi:hypothetical protein
MKNSLFIIFILGVMSISSCITTAQFNNAEDDVYYSPKASNKKQPVIIPEVDVDEIIKKNPPQYGQPTNSIEEVTPNPNAAAGYGAYRMQQDTLYAQNPRLSAYYIDPNIGNSAETEEADRLRKMYSNNYSNWNVGIGLGWWGPMFSIGYGNYNNGYYGYNGCNNWGYGNYYSPYNYGYGYGYGGYCGYNNFYNPWYGGYGYNSPWYGGGYYYPGYWNNGYYYDNNNGGNNSNSGNQSISRPRQAVGNTTPPANADNGGRSSVGSTSTNSSGGRYTAPQTNINNTGTETMQPNTNGGRATSNSNYKPATQGQTLETVNGRQVYTRPAQTQQQTQQNNNNQAPTQSNQSRGGGRANRSSNQTNTNTNTPQQTYTPSPTYSAPSNGGGRSSSGGGGRSSGGGSSSGSSGGGGGRRR